MEQRVGDLLAAMGIEPTSALRVLDELETLPGTASVEVDVRVSRPPPVELRTAAVMEHNLARHGGWWATHNARDASAAHDVFQFADRDTVGELVVKYTLGRLSTSDLRLVAWVLAQWRPDEAEIPFTKRGCTKSMGLTWGGTRAQALDEQIHRIAGTVFTQRVWSASTRRHERLTFTIVDVETSDRRERANSSARDGVVRLVLSRFLADQLRAGQFAHINWDQLQSLRSDLAQRLYIFLKSQRGWPDGEGMRFEIGIDHELAVSLGYADPRMRQFRRKLVDAGQDICRVDPAFLAVEVRPGPSRSYVLSSRRRAGEKDRLNASPAAT